MQGFASGPIGINLNKLNFSSNLQKTVFNVGVGVVAGIATYEVIKWGTAIFLVPETLGGSLGVAAALP